MLYLMCDVSGYLVSLNPDSKNIPKRRIPKILHVADLKVRRVLRPEPKLDLPASAERPGRHAHVEDQQLRL